MPRGPRWLSAAPSSRTFFDACLEVLARRLRRRLQGRSSTPASRTFLVVYVAFFKGLFPPLPPRPSLVVAGPPPRAFFHPCLEVLPRRVRRLVQGPSST